MLSNYGGRPLAQGFSNAKDKTEAASHLPLLSGKLGASPTSSPLCCLSVFINAE